MIKNQEKELGMKGKSRITFREEENQSELIINLQTKGTKNRLAKLIYSLIGLPITLLSKQEIYNSNE